MLLLYSLICPLKCKINLYLLKPGLHVKQPAEISDTVADIADLLRGGGGGKPEAQDPAVGRPVLQCSQAAEPLCGLECAVRASSSAGSPTAHPGHVSTQPPQIACRFFTHSNVLVCKLR